ncbi:MAG: hypothetical protein JW901_05585 [Dehalococcoidia bacterium]|nr:hypothetical protein [Dehalococcoidia bacterium]
MSAEYHDRLTAAFYEAKRAGNITPELQAIFDKLHGENWILDELDRPGTEMTAAALIPYQTTEAEKAQLEAVIRL